MRRLLVLAVVALLLVTEPAGAIRGSGSPNAQWTLGSGTFWNIDTLILPGSEPAVAGTPNGVFYNTQFYPSGGTYAYMGLQTDRNGKRAIVSWWDAIGCAGASGASCVTHTEGSGGKSLRLPYNWAPGRTYRLRAWFNGQSRTQATWVFAVRDTATGVETTIGEMYVPASHGWLTGTVVGWTEIYGVGTAPGCPFSTVYFDSPRANNGAVTAPFPAQWIQPGGNGGCPAEVAPYGNWSYHRTG